MKNENQPKGMRLWTEAFEKLSVDSWQNDSIEVKISAHPLIESDILSTKDILSLEGDDFADVNYKNDVLMFYIEISDIKNRTDYLTFRFYNDYCMVEQIFRSGHESKLYDIMFTVSSRLHLPTIIKNSSQGECFPLQKWNSYDISGYKCLTIQGFEFLKRILEEFDIFLLSKEKLPCHIFNWSYMGSHYINYLKKNDLYDDVNDETNSL